MFNAVEQAVKTHIGIRRGTITLSQKKREKTILEFGSAVAQRFRNGKHFGDGNQAVYYAR